MFREVYSALYKKESTEKPQARQLSGRTSISFANSLHVEIYIIILYSPAICLRHWDAALFEKLVDGIEALALGD